MALKSSGCGLVVLSRAFFSKAWTNWELDGLVQLSRLRKATTIVPIWLDVGHADVAEFSPSLANIVAIRADSDPARTAQEALRVVRPQRSVGEVARDILAEFGFPAPSLSDDWWLDVAAATALAPGEGTFQENSSWGWWGFPLPSIGETVEARGERLAWAAMQRGWQQAAVLNRLSQCTSPERVLSFLDEQPGLAATAEVELDFLLAYAPQLGIVGSGGFLESEISDVFRKALPKIRAAPTRGAPGWILRDPDFLGVPPTTLAHSYFWPMDPAGTAPDAGVLAWVDAACWVASDASGWMPTRIRDALRAGLYERSTYRYGLASANAEKLGVIRVEGWTNHISSRVYEEPKRSFVRSAQDALQSRISTSVALLDLPEAPSYFVRIFHEVDVLGEFWEVSRLSLAGRNRKSRKGRRTKSGTDAERKS